VQKPTPAIPLLDYADLPTRHGIEYEIRPDGVSFILPPAPFWKRPEIIVAAVVILLLALNNMPSAMRVGVGEVISNVVTFSFVGLILVVGLWTLRVTRRIELTPDALLLENIAPVMWSDPIPRQLRYARENVYDVQFIRHSGNLIIRVHGSEMIEFSPSNDPRVKEWMAAELRRTLGLPA